MQSTETKGGHDADCEDFYVEYGAPEGGLRRVCGEWVDGRVA